MSRITQAPIEAIVATPSAGTVTGAGITQALTEVIVFSATPARLSAALVEVIVASDGSSGAGDPESGGGGGGGGVHSFGYAG